MQNIEGFTSIFGDSNKKTSSHIETRIKRGKRIYFLHLRCFASYTGYFLNKRKIIPFGLIKGQWSKIICYQNTFNTKKLKTNTVNIISNQINYNTTIKKPEYLQTFNGIDCNTNVKKKNLYTKSYMTNDVRKIQND